MAFRTLLRPRSSTRGPESVPQRQGVKGRGVQPGAGYFGWGGVRVAGGRQLAHDESFEGRTDF